MAPRTSVVGGSSSGIAGLFLGDCVWAMAGGRRLTPDFERDEPSESALYSVRRASFSASDSMWNELRIRMSSAAMQNERCFPAA
eukprot:2161697-Pleurochrysis_carterae.AAC.1